VEFLLRRFGVDRLLDLCNTCRPATFDADCRRAYGFGVDELETMLWSDMERGASAPATAPGGAPNSAP